MFSDVPAYSWAMPIQRDIIGRCNEERVKRLRNTCLELGLHDDTIDWNNRTNRYWIVDDVHKIFYCSIPKAASTSMRTVLAMPIVGRVTGSVLRPMDSYMDATGFRFLHRIPANERQKVLNEYLKIIVVRHPMDRLRSAYLQKMSKPAIKGRPHVLNAHTQLVDRYLHQNGRFNNTTSFDICKSTITFNEFIELITLYNEDFTNEHWRLYYKTCYPCSIKYDIIMRVETLDNDVTVIYNNLGYNDETPAHTPQKNNMLYRVLPRDKLHGVKGTFSDVDSNVVDDILRIYDRDLRMFGYNWDPDHGANCADDSQDCC